MEQIMKDFDRAVLRRTVNKLASQHLHAATAVDLYAQGGSTERHTGTANMLQNLANEIRLTLHSQKLQSDTRKDHVVVTRVAIFEECRGLKYQYTFKTNDEVPATLGDMHRVSMYVCDAGEWLQFTSPRRQNNR